MTSHRIDNAIPLAAPVYANAHAHLSTQIAFFTHTVRSKVNSIKFSHQALCSPKISTLLKAIRCGYLKGCPNLTAKGVTKYLNQSPVTAKGHMKWPRQGIRSKRTHPTAPGAPVIAQDVIDNDTLSSIDPAHGPLVPGPNVIQSNNVSANKANLFCFVAFADKRTGTLCNDLTGTFPFMLLEDNVCFPVVYHYESYAILALPISGFSDEIIFAAYKKQYELLESKGFDIKLNVMDNQASKIIKQYLTPKQCNLMLVKSNNHCVNAAERAIQTFKDHFVSALATTDSEFLLQL
jgi:hypothetical protein